MLFGKFTHTVDAKNRIFIPAKYREELGSEFVIFKSIRDAYINVMTLEEWERYIAPIKALPRKVSETAIRQLTEAASQVSPDSQGRIVITPELLAFAGIDKNAVILGCENHAEIWSEEAYGAQKEDVDPEEIRRALEECGL